MVAQLVRQARERLGLTQTELAERSGLRQTYISQIENGDIKMPRDHNLDALGGVLGLGRAEFYRAAGMFEGIGNGDNGNGQPPAPLPLPPRDADTVPLAQKVADVEARRGEHYQARLRVARATMTRPQYEAWCAALWGMWGGNAEMVFTLLDGRAGDE